MSVHTQNLL